MRLTSTLAAAFAAITLAGSASALTYSGTACTTASLSLGGIAADACSGIWNGNDSNQDLDGLFDSASMDYDWTFVAKLNTPGSYEGDASFGLTASGGTSGTWGVTSFNGYETVMVVLKGGNTFSAFLFNDVGSRLMGLFNTQSNLKGNGTRGPGLSHISLYVTGTPSEVPLPAAGLLLAGALGALGLAKRRKA